MSNAITIPISNFPKNLSREIRKINFINELIKRGMNPSGEDYYFRSRRMFKSLIFKMTPSEYDNMLSLAGFSQKDIWDIKQSNNGGIIGCIDLNLDTTVMPPCYRITFENDGDKDIFMLILNRDGQNEKH